MRRFLRRQALPVAIILGALITLVVVLALVAVLAPGGGVGSCGPKVLLCLQPLGLRWLVGLICIAGLPLNAVALGLVVGAALRRPLSDVMDERVETFLVVILASLAWAILGLYLLIPPLQVAMGQAIGIDLVLGILISVGIPIVFLLNVRLRRRRAR